MHNTPHTVTRPTSHTLTMGWPAASARAWAPLHEMHHNARKVRTGRSLLKTALLGFAVQHDGRVAQS